MTLNLKREYISKRASVGYLSLITFTHASPGPTIICAAPTGSITAARTVYGLCVGVVKGLSFLPK